MGIRGTRHVCIASISLCIRRIFLTATNSGNPLTTFVLSQRRWRYSIPEQAKFAV
ncbi:hypothetical protein BDR04DRAFT_1111912 [Suillus decipiens]|nr:hypothetical protein BDR04DRAFT_1111912 [Suillus decipiens]